jgi:hypothetical protein
MRRSRTEDYSVRVRGAWSAFTGDEVSYAFSSPRAPRTAAAECMGAGRDLTRQLDKTPKPGELNDLLSRQDRGDQFTLRRSVNFI